MSYQVHLENFEGPLDLLLYFIQRDKIDIYDIPISHITAEYLSYLDLMESLNIAVAGEFIKHREGDRLGLILFADRAQPRKN